MPLAGNGMLLTSMDIDLSDEADFNRWYDREHLAERVAIDGFIEARRYIADRGAPKYLCLYSTETFDVLHSPAYRAALANPTEWTKRTMARFRNMLRAVARITISRGQGRGAALGIIRLRPPVGTEERLRVAIAAKLNPTAYAGIVSMHLIESDAALSRPNTDTAMVDTGIRDWFVLIDGSDVETISDLMTTQLSDDALEPGAQISAGVYRLMWDLAQCDLTYPANAVANS